MIPFCRFRLGSERALATIASWAASAVVETVAAEVTWLNRNDLNCLACRALHGLIVVRAEDDVNSSLVLSDSEYDSDS